MGQGIWRKRSKECSLEEEREPFHRINVDCLGNILLVLSDQLAANQELKDSALYMLFLEARKMGGHDHSKIINWIQQHFSITLTHRECENLVSYVGLFLPFETEMETVEEDFHFVQQRCLLIPPSLHLMKEWAVQVKLMEKNVRIARGYIQENYSGGLTTKHSKDRLRKKKRKKVKKISVSTFQKDQSFFLSEPSGESLAISRNEPSPLHGVSDGNYLESSMLDRQINCDESDEESKECLSPPSSNSYFTRVIQHSRHSQLGHFPEEKIEDITPDGSSDG